MKRSERDWTIVAILYRDPCPVDPWHPAGWKSRCEKYIVNRPLKSEAEDIVAGWFAADRTRLKNLDEVHYYPRNYVDDARRLRAAGRVIE